jgi:excisionase family DNA binding protein
VGIDIISDIVYIIIVRLGMYSVKEAARKIGISDSHCRRLLERGEIEGKKLGHDWVVLSLDYKRKRKPKQKVKGESNGLGE